MTTERPAGLREAIDRERNSLSMTPATSDYGRAYNDGLNDLADRLTGRDGVDRALAAPAPEVDVERLARAIEVVSEGRPEYIVTGAEHAIYWTNEMVAKHIAAEYARLREDVP